MAVKKAAKKVAKKVARSAKAAYFHRERGTVREAFPVDTPPSPKPIARKRSS